VSGVLLQAVGVALKSIEKGFPPVIFYMDCISLLRQGGRRTITILLSPNVTSWDLAMPGMDDCWLLDLLY